MKNRVIAIALACFVYLMMTFTLALPASASSARLVPCDQSKAFVERINNAPDNYYFEQPNQAYGAQLLCGEDGLPHLSLDQPGHPTDALLPILFFLYIAGFIGWSGRAYLQATKSSKSPEEKEIFIDLSLARNSFSQALLWPLLTVREISNKEFTADNDELSVSPR